MIERFLKYSMEHAKPIRLLILNEAKGKMRFMNTVVVSFNESDIFFIRPSKKDMGKAPQKISRDLVLSADYARGDDGDTLQFTQSSD